MVVVPTIACNSSVQRDEDKGVIDSGATVTLISPAVAKRNNFVLSKAKTPYVITYAEGNTSHTDTIARIGDAIAVVDNKIKQSLIAVNTLLATGYDVIFSRRGSCVRHVLTGNSFPISQNDDTHLWEITLTDYKNLTTSSHLAKMATLKSETDCDVVELRNNQSDYGSYSTFLAACDYTVDANGNLVERVISDYDKRLLVTLIKIHTIMGHASVGNMYKAIHGGMWLNTGIQAQDIRRLWSHYQCVACIMAKSNAIPVSAPTDDRTTIPGHTISTDPVPVSPPGPNGEKWIFFFKCVATRYWISRLGMHKSEFPAHLLDVILWLKSVGHPMRILRTDDEAVLQSAEVMEMLAEHGRIEAQYSVPYQHYQNTVERDVQTLIKFVCALLFGQYILKQWMWTFAVHWVTKTQNNTPNALCGDISPEFLMTGKTINFANTFAFTFGELVAVGIRKEARVWKFDTKRELGVYLGQPEGYVDGHLIFMPYDASVLVRGDVISLRIVDEQIAQFYLTRFRMTQKKLAYPDMLSIVDYMGLDTDGEPLPVKEGPVYRIAPKERMPTRSNPAQGVPVDNVNIEVDDDSDFPMPELYGSDLSEESGISTPSVCIASNSGQCGPETGPYMHSPLANYPVGPSVQTGTLSNTINSVPNDCPNPEPAYVNSAFSDITNIGSFMGDESPIDIVTAEANATRTRGPTNPTINTALKSPDALQWRAAIKAEVLTNLLGTGAIKAVDHVPEGANRSEITMQLKLKPDKWKARGCYRGDLLEKGYAETYSPTISTLTYSFVRNVAVIDAMEESLVDTVAAFLAQVYPEDAPPLYVKLPLVVAECAGLDPYQWYRVHKYIYGIPDAGRAYYKAYSSLLVQHGYVQSNNDPCLFYKFTLEGPLYIWIHTR